ncbi:TPA: phage protein Gp27 family protein [Stenotrophomonas maltophilia]
MTTHFSDSSQKEPVMPPSPKVFSLSDDLRRELDKQIRANRFGNYEGISAWLAKQGVSIGKSALHNYGGKLKKGKLAVPTPPLEAGISSSEWWCLPRPVLASLASRLLQDPAGPLRPHAEWLTQQGHRLSIQGIEVYRQELVATVSRQRCAAALADIQSSCAPEGDAVP